MMTPKKSQQVGSIKDVPKKSTRRRQAMTSDEINEMKELLKNTPKKTRPGISPIDPSVETNTKIIVLKGSEVFIGKRLTTPEAPEQFWERNLTEWENKMEQVRIYCTINNTKLDQEEVDIICQATLNYISWHSSLANIQDIKLKETINRPLPSPGYNPAKGIPWLVAVWPLLVEYMAKGDIYELPQAEIQGEKEPARRRLFEKPRITDIEEKEEDEEEQEFPEDSSYSLVQEILNLKALLEDALKMNQKFQQRIRFLEEKYVKGKKKITFDNELVELSSDDSEGEEPSQRAREPTPSMLEYEKITGIKQRVGKPSKELQDATKYAKIIDPPMCNGKDQKWRSPQQFDYWFSDIVDWLELQRIDIRKPLAFARVGSLFEETAKVW